ncbi:eukaryotic mitochondrial regulator protein-domain-containing protein [Apodospora peruviana]|uniref:Eukaryotic mitochondrial regulator protein-domain-containing protein n=1 Tax=Apodospora peruviana TaxID=516989 RepID=A0AAE0IU15_9PEZI|nr:eukaryotic mitochondrial regulator protein-domain-containing protein [Apodospora peruviana]
MPPRIRSSQALLLNGCSSPLLSSFTPSHTVAAAAGAAQTTRQCPPSQHTQTSYFSTTAPLELTRLRRDFETWLRTQGKRYRDPTPGEPCRYLGNTKQFSPKGKVFPLNPEFISQPVLSESAREKIWRSVMVDAQPLKAVSAKYSVDMRRVAAVLRLKAIEKQWEQEGKQMALPYAKSVLEMVPVNHLTPERPHEPINDIHVHGYTMQQIFLPTSESREFTRADAAKAFGEHILPVDQKMRIPELLAFEKDLVKGEERRTAEENFYEATTKSERDIADRELIKSQLEEKRKLRVDTDRFEFRFEQISVDKAGRKGRSRSAVGWRYGVPYNDRRRGVVKIPTSVE